ncbi:MAG: hypothetical protein LBT64_00450 [Puniceicoccales bacterium]|jgi:hypothetical protein|nr:hypothetical protein [Puniceicoccales bacterium]
MAIDFLRLPDAGLLVQLGVLAHLGVAGDLKLTLGDDEFVSVNLFAFAILSAIENRLLSSIFLMSAATSVFPAMGVGGADSTTLLSPMAEPEVGLGLGKSIFSKFAEFMTFPPPMGVSGTGSTIPWPPMAALENKSLLGKSIFRKFVGFVAFMVLKCLPHIIGAFRQMSIFLRKNRCFYAFTVDCQ